MIKNEEYDKIAKLYKVSYRVYGTTSAGSETMLMDVSDLYMIGMNVMDINTELVKEYVNMEFNQEDGQSLMHFIGSRIVLDSVNFIGVLSHMTTDARRAFEMVDKYYYDHDSKIDSSSEDDQNDSDQNDDPKDTGLPMS